MGEKVNFCVPTGNFGDILAAYYAKRMGLPVDKLICASNRNDVLTDFLRTGVYDRNRPFHTTMSPSMDILVSSNLERLLFDLSGENDAEVRGYMEALSRDGRYEVSDAIKAALKEQYWGGFCGEEDTAATIGHYYQDYGYLIDTHTAVAANVMEQYRAATGDKTRDRVCLHRIPLQVLRPCACRHWPAPGRATDWSCWTSSMTPPACRSPGAWRH